MREVPIHDEHIRLGQLLKLANLVASGADVKQLLVDKAVSVNGQVETRRGRRNLRKDVVSFAGEEISVI